MRYVLVRGSDALPDISRFAPFKAIVVVEVEVTSGRQAEISTWLFSMGCRYVMACGSGCESWQAAARRANAEAFDPETVEPRNFMMSTVHPRERLLSVFWYAKKYANHPEVDVEDDIVVHLGERDRSTEYQALFQRA